MVRDEDKMQRYEYKVVPAPVRGEKGRGLKTTVERFSNALSNLMNELSRDGWEYQRSDTLPAEERSGLTGRVTVYHNILVFRRPVAEVTRPAEATPAAAFPLRSPLSTQAPTGVAPKIVADAEGASPQIGPAARSREPSTPVD
jgi:hypothetical protein